MSGDPCEADFTSRIPDGRRVFTTFRPVARHIVMEHFVIHSTFSTISTALIWGGLAVVAAIFAVLMISESSSGVRPPGCQRGTPANKFVR
jgi:hypothetical protein